MREVKLATTLKRLVDEGDYRGNRKQVCTELGITTAALSQYINGQTTPGLDKLIALADLFKVSLDYLIFGEDAVAGPRGTLEYGPLVRYVEAGLSSMRADIASQSAFVAKIGTIMSDQIANAAQIAAKRSTTLYGMLDKEQALELERHSLVSTNVTLDMDDIVEVRSDVEEGVTGGDFLEVVAENLSKHRSYHFVLSPDMPDRELIVDQYRSLLLRKKLSPKDMERCRFSIASDTFYVGFNIFELDIEGFRQNSPILYQYVRSYIGTDNRIGYVESPSASLEASFLMDTDRRKMAARVLQRLLPEA
ncbi:helix-turn-helix domain-containing protein [Nocardia sp. NPDC051570]|uniref:helix-turn-helix domain-containing protein n=1 Tax=Nocardia sp. NPDC051570 TaxID=3364324 RepID=UPI003788280D